MCRYAGHYLNMDKVKTLPCITLMKPVSMDKLTFQNLEEPLDCSERPRGRIETTFPNFSTDYPTPQTFFRNETSVVHLFRRA